MIQKQTHSQEAYIALILRKTFHNLLHRMNAYFLYHTVSFAKTQQSSAHLQAVFFNAGEALLLEGCRKKP